MKFDINLDATRDIERFSEEKGISLLGRIPFDEIFIKAMVQGQTVVEYNSDSKTGRAVKDVWRNLIERLSR